MRLTAQNVSLAFASGLALVIGISIPGETAAALGWLDESDPGIVTGLSIILFTGLGAWAIGSTPMD